MDLGESPRNRLAEELERYFMWQNRLDQAGALEDLRLYVDDPALLVEIDPLKSGAVFYAAIAGVWLFAAGLVSGYVDNLTVYSDAGARIARLPWLVRLAGAARAERIGELVYRKAGGVAGNIFFGFALGLTTALGKNFGLPLDIRHIAFSSANLGYALTRPTNTGTIS